jgi:hypothetical protein
MCEIGPLGIDLGFLERPLRFQRRHDSREEGIEAFAEPSLLLCCCGQLFGHELRSVRLSDRREQEKQRLSL